MRTKHLKDPTGLLFKIIVKYQQKLSGLYWSRRMSFYLAIRGIQQGKKNRFFGKAFMRRHIHSTIKFGHGNTFRSTIPANIAGVSHRCIFGTVREGAVLEIGNNCGFSGVSIGAAGHVKIGNNVLIGADTFITDFDGHSSKPDLRHIPLQEWAPVEIKDNVFIGYNTSILKGVTIGENSVIGANSLVVKDIPDNVIAIGCPARVVAQLKPSDPNWNGNQDHS